MSDAKPMPQKDRSALRTVVKKRFELLTSQLRQREHEVRSLVEKQIQDENAAAIKQARKETERFNKEAKKLGTELHDFLVQMERKIEALVEEGVEFQGEMAGRGLQPSSYHEAVIDSNLRNFLTYWRESWSDEEDRFPIHVRNGWEPVDFGRRIDEAVDQIKQQSGLHKLDLEMRELELTEELLVGGIASDAGREFLEKVPTVDSLLPAPHEAVKVIGS